jgi:hypothetical protein
MLAPNEELYANFICRNIHFMHHVEFVLITSDSRCFPVNSSPPPTHQQEENEAPDMSN